MRDTRERHIELYRSIKDHRRVTEAADALNIPVPYMIGLLSLLWLWATDNAPDGDLTGLSPRTISRAVQWEGDPQELMDTLISAGWIELSPGRMTLHNWECYTGRLIQKREREKTRSRQRRAKEPPAAELLKYVK